MLVEQYDNSPCSISSSVRRPEGVDSPSDKKALSTVLMDILFAPRDVGGYGGSLRYCEMEPLLHRVGHHWKIDRLDDCWYDMVRGRPLSVVSDVVWAAQCIQQHINDVRTERSPHAQSDPLQENERDMKSPMIDLTSPISAESSGRERQVIEDIAPRQILRQRSRKSTPLQSLRFASPTQSSIHRRRASSVNSAVRRRKGPTQKDEVFHRLIEDAKSRQSRSSSIPNTENTAKTIFRAESGMAAAAATKSSVTKGTASPFSSVPRRRAQSPVLQWEKLTKSYQAKLAPEPARPDPLVIAAATPTVTRREPLGPSSCVPPGYVEAVARLRRLAEQKKHMQFTDSLRTVEPVETTPVDSAPILRLPLVKGESAVDVRLCPQWRNPQVVAPAAMYF